MKIRKELKSVTFLAVALLLVNFIFSSKDLSSEDKIDALVVDVIDGDTLILRLKDRRTVHARLIGVDCPELRPNDKAFRDSKKGRKSLAQILKLGARAKTYVKTLVKRNDRVSVEFDIMKYDRYKRLLGYVYLKDGTLLNEQIIKEGYAYPLNVTPNTKFSKNFRNAYLRAREKKAGLWGGG